MSRVTMIWLMIAGVLILVGLVLFMCAFAKLDFDVSKLNTMKCETNTYEVSGDFENISIKESIAKLQFLPSEDDSCRVVCKEWVRMKHSVTVKDGTLVIEQIDTRRWIDYFGISFGELSMTVYLPKTAYASLSIDTSTGDLTVPSSFSFENVNIFGSTADVTFSAPTDGNVRIQLSTGDIKFSSQTAGDLTVKTSTGRIYLNDLSCANLQVESSTGRINLSDLSCVNLQVNSSTGRITLTNLSCKNLRAKSNTGSVLMQSVIARGNFSIETDTGDVELHGCDAAEIYIETDTGDVEGELLSEKVFFASSDTGRVDVPKTISGGRCEIETDTGDIKFRIQN